MNRQSIFFTISVSFIISVILVITSFLILITNNYRVKEGQFLDKYIPIVKMVMRQERLGIDDNFLKNLEEMGYFYYINISEINAITYNPQTKILVEKNDPRNNDIFRVITLDDKNYIYTKKRHATLLIRDGNSSTSNSQLYISLVFAILLITIILVYLITLRKLIPLKILKDKVKTLGNENFDFECCNSNSKDEVSLLGMEFKKTALKLKSLKEARNIFIRNIMHELKTPITKGKFLTQLEFNDENNEKLKSVFYRLESLINEFAS
ncbi:MAG: sensor histidine kinase, partial [Aliarcobacter sp.]|nr:sensor histidine kinase [Aliarcobacter sp.]